MADTLILHYIFNHHFSEVITFSKEVTRRNPDLACAYHALSYSEDSVHGLRAAKKGMKCKNITPNLRNDMLSGAIHHAGRLRIKKMRQALHSSRLHTKMQRFSSCSTA
ncbi:hypothetical protein AcW1_009458 [Taiwanofungus camphoratus]|nr:hypothetical protein AcV7_006953 [Antrodia cinnamomea]KAI0947786.1 hypothetical protein AcW1_009458 [Antrodia cinnamomea]